MKPFLAMITPVMSGAHPDHELPKPQPPTGGQPPHPDQTLPGDLPHPEHPIYYPLPPGAPVDPEYGIPEDGPHPDQGLPGAQPRPDHDLPPFPSHPIVLPPDSGGWKPVYIWGPGDPRPTPPIALPPGGTVDVGGDKLKVSCIWTPENGWETIVVLKPQGAHATPSKRK
jgi:hypothetical protein